MNNKNTYIAIDLKSFYASVECMERGRDPLTTNLVVADAGRTEKTICLAVSPALKAYGIPGRPRLFEVVQRVRDVNEQRRRKAPGQTFAGSTDDAEKLTDPSLSLAYITAVPRMALYMEYSTRIYDIYLKYAAPEDIHVYSVDEVFIDVSPYLDTYGMTAHELTRTMIRDVLKQTGITATAGIGENLYLCKIAMDIVAKHIPADQDGGRIAELSEISYRKLLWDHKPLTDFWRVGPGYAKKLAEKGLYTMGDIARCSIGKEEDYYNEDLLYSMFGVNAELLIDHAWGWEPCTIRDIKAYRPEERSMGAGQVLSCPYTAEKARLVVWEIADQIALDLLDKRLAAKQIVLTIGYDVDNLSAAKRSSLYEGEVVKDRYGRKVPRHAHGTENIERYTSSSRLICRAAEQLFDKIVNKDLLIRRITLSVNKVIPENEISSHSSSYEQMDLFTDYKAKEQEENELVKERKLQEAMLTLKKRYGKNAVLRGSSYEEGATARERNKQIGGHKA